MSTVQQSLTPDSDPDPESLSLGDLLEARDEDGEEIRLTHCPSCLLKFKNRSGVEIPEHFGDHSPEDFGLSRLDRNRSGGERAGTDRSLTEFEGGEQA